MAATRYTSLKVGFTGPGTPSSARAGYQLGGALLLNIVPATKAANNICASQSVSSGVAALLNGTTAGTLDLARTTLAAWTGTAIITVKGLDQYGVAVTESSASGTSFTGKKAMVSITSVTFNANVTLATVGTGDVFGFPFVVANAGYILRYAWNNTLLNDAGTLAVADTTDPATATTGDTRGTFAPSSAADGSKRLMIWGSPPFTESYAAQFGVAQYGT